MFNLAKLVLGPFEKSLQASQLARRRFWSTPSDIPVFIRRRGDGLFFGLVLGSLAYQTVLAPVRISDHLPK